MPFDRRAFVLHEARKHIWLNFNMARSIEKLHELYAELVPEVSGAPANKAGSAIASLPPELATFVPPKPPVVEIPVPVAATPADEGVREVSKSSEAGSAEANASKAASKAADAAWSLDAALSTTVLAAFKVEKEVPQTNDSMEWSESESELISSMMVAVDPSEVKPIVVERPKPNPAPVTAGNSEEAEAKARARRLLDARRAELQATTATANAKPATPAAVPPTQAAKG